MEEMNFEEEKQTKKSSRKSTFWLVFLALIIILGIVLVFVFSDRVTPEPDSEFEHIQGLVVSVDLAQTNFVVSSSLLEETEDGKATIKDIVYNFSWEREDEITPHHPRLLRGGERVKVWTKEKTTMQKTDYSVQGMEILRVPQL